MFTTDVRPVFTTRSRVEFTTGRSGEEISGSGWRVRIKFQVQRAKLKDRP
jgi:hypothetical protein